MQCKKNKFAPKPSIQQQIALLTFCGFYFIRWFMAPMTASEWVINILGLIVFLALYFTAFNLHNYNKYAPFGMILVSVAVAPYNFGSNSFAIYACSFYAYGFRARYAILFCAFTIACVGATTLYFDVNFISYFVITSVISVGLTASGIFDRQRIIHEQKQLKSQEEVSRLAKIAERERISQDLHDVVGHALTSIHLKSQLAAKLIDKGNTGDAKRHINDIQISAQTTLKEIRQTLSGIYKVGLKAELIAQQAFLNSLGIQFTFNDVDYTLPPSLESDLLLIIRESITNIVRHSQATDASLIFHPNRSQLHLQIKDNGKGLQESAPLGSGLNGIKNRVERNNGSIVFKNEPGLTLELTIPINRTI